MRPIYRNAGLIGASTGQFVEHLGHLDEECRHSEHLRKGSTGVSGFQRLILREFTLM